MDVAHEGPHPKTHFLKESVISSYEKLSPLLNNIWVVPFRLKDIMNLRIINNNLSQKKLLQLKVKHR